MGKGPGNLFGAGPGLVHLPLFISQGGLESCCWQNDFPGFLRCGHRGARSSLSYSPHVRNDLIQLFLGHTLPACDRWTYPVTSGSIAQCTSFDDTKQEVYKLCPSHTQPGHWLGTRSLRRAHDLQLTPHLN